MKKRLKKPVLLVTGFGPFDDNERNPSGEVAEAANGKSISGMEIIGKQIDVSWSSAWKSVYDSVAANKPDCLLCLGMAPGPFIRLEILAKNVALPHEDIHKDKPQLFDLLKIVEDAPAAYWTTLPVDWLHSRLTKRPKTELKSKNTTHILEVGRWTDTGWYLCNYLFFHVMHFLQSQVPYRGFVHIPEYPDEKDQTEISDEQVFNSGLALVEELAIWLAKQASFSQKKNPLENKKKQILTGKELEAYNSHIRALDGMSDENLQSYILIMPEYTKQRLGYSDV